MEHYVTYHKILDLCEDFQIQSPILKSFGYGNLVDFGKNTSGTTTQYPFMFMVPQAITYDENTTTYQFSILFADILNTNLDNEKDCVSDMSLEARRFISFIKRGMNANPDLYNYMDIQMGVQAIPFQERMNDHTAGVALQANIIVFEDINACNYYPTPTPTACSVSGTYWMQTLQLNSTQVTFELWNTNFTSGATSPTSFTINGTGFLTSGGTINLSFSFPLGGNYETFTYTGQTGGATLSGITVDSITDYDTYCVTYVPTGYYDLIQCSDDQPEGRTINIPQYLSGVTLYLTSQCVTLLQNNGAGPPNFYYQGATTFVDCPSCVGSTPTPTVTSTPTPTPTCPITTQYLEVVLSSCHNFKLAVYEDAGFTIPTNALCDYSISGTATGDMGTVYSGVEIISAGQHQHNFNLNPVLQPGECIISFVVHSANTNGCTCPVNLVLPTP